MSEITRKPEPLWKSGDIVECMDYRRGLGSSLGPNFKIFCMIIRSHKIAWGPGLFATTDYRIDYDILAPDGSIHNTDKLTPVTGIYHK